MELARLVLRLVGPRLTARVLPEWCALGFAVVQADAIVEWAALAETLTARAWWEIAGVWALAALVHAPTWQRSLRRMLYGDRMRFLWRQPIGALRWSVVGAPLALVVGAPFGGLAAMTYGVQRLDLVALWAALGGTVALATAARVRWWPVVAIGAVAVAHAVEGAAVLTAPVLLAAGPLMRRGVEQVPARLELPGRPRTWLTALVRLDLLALLRDDPGRIVGAALLAPVAAAVLLGLRVNGGLRDGALAVAGLIVVGLASVGVQLGMDRLVGRLGPRVWRPAWPVGPRARALSLAVVALALLAPTWAFAAPVVGVAAQPGLVSLGASLSAGSAWLAVRSRGRGIGAWPWWLAVCLAASLAPAGTLWTAALAAIAVELTARVLWRRR